MKLNFFNIPSYLKKFNNWVVWKLEVKVNSKPTKIPYNAITGKRASVTDQSHWSSFEEIKLAYKSGIYDGIGFVVTKNTKLMFVDFDHVFDPSTKTFDKTALEDILSLQTYAEMSPSGTGAHALGISEKTFYRKRTTGIELYNDMRFFTLTGLHINITCDTINELSDECLEELYNKRFSNNTESKEQSNFELEMPKFEGSLTLKDSDIITLCADVFTYTYFKELWNGNWKEKFESQSEADIFLCSLLSTFTFNPFQLDRLFRKSKLYRPKWDEYRGRYKYSEMTIYKVLNENIRGGVYVNV